MTGSSIAQILTSLATLVGVVGGIIVQIRGQNESRSARADLSDKIDTNTALTQATAVKVEDVHTSIVEATGSHQILK